MSVRRYTIASLVAASIVVPILIGASCPPPTSPGIIGLVTDTANVTVLPRCNTGFVCINFTNSTVIPVQVVLYRHNGFDSSNKCGSLASFSCCTNPNSTVACPCPCAGASTGECKLNFDNLFTGCSLDPPTANVDPVNGANVNTLAPSQSIQKQVRCADVKTLGAAVSRTTVDPLVDPADQFGPVYRGEAGGVSCGGTVQFLVVDLTTGQNNTTTGGTGSTGTDALVTLAIQAQFSR